MRKIASFVEKAFVGLLTIGIYSMVVRFLVAFWNDQVTNLESAVTFGILFVFVAFVMFVSSSLLYDYLKSEK